MDKTQAINQFWNSFTWKAYDETDVPTTLTMPYITYGVSLDGFNHPVAMSASLWNRSTSWKDITLKADEIESTIGLGGAKVNYDGGQVWIKKGSPFAQHMADPDATIRRIVLNIEIEYIGE
jgi:hypothetical protein